MGLQQPSADLVPGASLASSLHRGDPTPANAKDHERLAKTALAGGYAAVPGPGAGLFLQKSPDPLGKSGRLVVGELRLLRRQTLKRPWADPGGGNPG